MPESLQTASDQATQPIRNYSRLSQAELALILKLHDDGKTQTYIAQQIGCNQSSVSEALKNFSDTTGLAKRKAHNLALKAVQKLELSMDQAAEQGKSGPMDSILKMSGLLGQDQAAGMTFVIGGDLSDVTFACSTVAVTPVIHSLSDAHGSDK